MAEQKKPVEAATAAPGEKRSVSRLRRGSESGDPAVQQLLAARYIAAQNGDQAAVDAASAALRDLGFE